jgi:hypothetical protein
LIRTFRLKADEAGVARPLARRTTWPPLGRFTAALKKNQRKSNVPRGDKMKTWT